MKRIERNSAWFDERVEAFVDGMLEPEDEAAFLDRLDTDELLQQSVHDAMLVASVLRSRDESLAVDATCPPGVADRVLAMARAASDPTGDRDSVRPALRRVPVFRGRVVRLAAFAAAACIALVLLIRGGGSPSEQQYSDAEVDQALREVKFALAVISDASRDAGRSIRIDAVPPVSEAMGLVFTDGQRSKTPKDGEAAN